MKQIVSMGIIFLLIGLSIFPSVSSTNIIITQVLGPSKTVIQVDDDGDGDYTNIQDAVHNASYGDIIEVYSGTYLYMNVSLYKQLILKGIDSELGGGNGSGKPLIIGEIDHQLEMGLITVVVDGCSISGFHLKKSGSYCKTGIEVQSDNNHIFDNTIDDINFGIHLWESSNNRVYANEVTESQCAILNSCISHNNQIYDNYLYDCCYGIKICNFAENNTVSNNTISEINAIGIGTSRSNNNTIHENIITACGEGIGLWMEDDWGYGMTVFGNSISSCNRGIMITGKDHKIYQNDITYCKYGIHLETIETLPPIYCHRIEVYDNVIIWNHKIGLWIDYVYFSDIYNNNISRNGIYGILMEKAEENQIWENNITFNNKYGIHSWDSEWNLIYHNNIIGNPTNAWCDGAPNDRWNIWNTDHHGGNYWSDYDGEDKNNDGVGDKPYVIPDMDNNPFNNNKDKYPLMEPDGRPIPRPRTWDNWIFELMSILQRLLGFIK